METQQLSFVDQISNDVQISLKLLHNFVNGALSAGLVRNIEDTEPVLTALRTIKRHLDGSGTTAEPKNARTNRERRSKVGADNSATTQNNNGEKKENGATGSAEQPGSTERTGSVGTKKIRAKKINGSVDETPPVPVVDDLPFGPNHD